MTQQHDLWLEIKAEELAMQMENLDDEDVLAVLNRVGELLIGNTAASPIHRR